MSVDSIMFAELCSAPGPSGLKIYGFKNNSHNLPESPSPQRGEGLG